MENFLIIWQFKATPPPWIQDFIDLLVFTIHVVLRQTTILRLLYKNQCQELCRFIGLPACQGFNKLKATRSNMENLHSVLYKILTKSFWNFQFSVSALKPFRQQISHNSSPIFSNLSKPLFYEPFFLFFSFQSQIHIDVKLE